MIQSHYVNSVFLNYVNSVCPVHSQLVGLNWQIKMVDTLEPISEIMY